MEISNIIKSNFWPMSVRRISTLVDISLLKFISKMQEKMPGISEHSILMALEDSAAENGRVSTSKCNIRRNISSYFSIVTMGRVAIIFFEWGVKKFSLRNFNSKAFYDYFFV